jgi:hypothetical protein
MEIIKHIARNGKETFKRQVIYKSTAWHEGKDRYTMRVNLSFDDECKNGHEDFAITADIKENGREYMGGCCHDEISKRMPELAKYIKWHLCGIDGPMYYLGNTIYHAGNRDCNGLLESEPDMNPKLQEHIIKFDNVPISYKLKIDFAEFIKSRIGSGNFTVAAIAYENKKGNGYYDFAPKYTLNGFGFTWYDCPFSTHKEAQEFADALNTCKVEFSTQPTRYGKGKARDFDAARSCAIWPEATDEQLSFDKPELTKLLTARLPKLLAEFKADMLELGFVYPESEAITC